MASHRKWRPRRTLIDLYWERDKTKWYWRLFAALAASLILGGFIISPAAFEDDPKLSASKAAIIIVAIILLATGYSLSIMLFFVCKSWLFRLDVILLPCLSSSALGLLNVVYNFVIRSSLSWTAMSITAITIALASTTLYAILSILMFHKISIVRRRDALHRRPSSWQEDSSSLLPEDDAQRQQLLRLLRKSDADRAPSLALSQSTYRIDLPETVNLARQSNMYNQYPSPSHLATPQNVHEGRSRSQPPPTQERVPWGSQMTGGYVDNGFTSTLTRDTSAASREQRRQEIEMNQRMQQSYEVAADNGPPSISRITRVQTDGLGIR
ncbi:MAG: hypothetical protein M1830_000658 [Pleopsidium flavum]|nr:MAG: hypothetical protein M1830_000658 [Pleopsidium flavum]